MKRTFTVAQVRHLLNQVHQDKITFSRLVEILNKIADSGIIQDYYTFDEIEEAVFKGSIYYKNHPEDIPSQIDFVNSSEIELKKYAKDQALGICYIMDKEKNLLINTE